MTAEDFEAEDFEAEVHYPYAPPQQWVVLAEKVTPEQLAVYTFTMAHLNPISGKVDAKFGRGRVAERFGKSMDWVDKQFKGLVKAGAMSKRFMYWIDSRDHSKGRSPERVAPDGTKRSQAPNRWRVKMQPPGGPVYPGPIKISEFYKPDLIHQRLKEAGHEGAATQRPGPDQSIVDNQTAVDQPTPSTTSDYSENPSSEGGRHTTAGGAATQRPGGPPHNGPKEHEGKDHGENDHGNYGVGGQPPTPPWTEPLRGSVPENDNHSESRVTTESELSSNQSPARKHAGPAAVKALEENPEISQGELEKVIASANPKLTQPQVIGRAFRLLASEGAPGKLRVERPGDQEAPDVLDLIDVQR